MTFTLVAWPPRLVACVPHDLYFSWMASTFSCLRPTCDHAFKSTGSPYHPYSSARGLHPSTSIRLDRFEQFSRIHLSRLSRAVPKPFQAVLGLLSATTVDSCMYARVKIEINMHRQKYDDRPQMQNRDTRYLRGKPKVGKKHGAHKPQR